VKQQIKWCLLLNKKCKCSTLSTLTWWPFNYSFKKEAYSPKSKSQKASNVRQTSQDLIVQFFDVNTSWSRDLDFRLYSTEQCYWGRITCFWRKEAFHTQSVFEWQVIELVALWIVPELTSIFWTTFMYIIYMFIIHLRTYNCETHDEQESC
jgi:hypothetical protein